MPGLRQLLDEIHRRSLWQVLSVYLAGGWFALEVISTLDEQLLLPAWVFPLGIVLLLIGLPIILVTAFVQRGLRTRPLPSAAGLARLFTWRNALAGGVIAFALLGVATAARMLFVRDPGLPAVDDAVPAIAVFPFTVRGDEELAIYREGVADWLSRSLSVLDNVRVIDPGTVIRSVAAADGGQLIGAPAAASLASELEADFFVLGGVTGGGDRLHMYASLYDARVPERSVAEADVEGDPDDVLHLVGRVSAELLLPRLGATSARAVRSAARATDSQAALKAFLAAEQAIRVNDFPGAIASLETATAEDSTFALAWFRMSIAAALMETDGRYIHMLGAVPYALPRALELADRLGERDRTLLSAYAAFRRGDADEAERGFRNLLRTHPNDLEARFLLAQVLFRQNPPRGRPFLEAKEYFEQVLGRDPGFICPI